MIYSAHSWMNEQDRIEKKAEAGKEKTCFCFLVSVKNRILEPMQRKCEKSIKKA